MNVDYSVFRRNKWRSHLFWVMNINLYYYVHLKEIKSFLFKYIKYGNKFLIYKGETIFCYQDSKLHPGAELSWLLESALCLYVNSLYEHLNRRSVVLYEEGNHGTNICVPWYSSMVVFTWFCVNGDLYFWLSGFTLWLT